MRPLQAVLAAHLTNTSATPCLDIRRRLAERVSGGTALPPLPWVDAPGAFRGSLPEGFVVPVPVLPEPSDTSCSPA